MCRRNRSAFPYDADLLARLKQRESSSQTRVWEVERRRLRHVARSALSSADDVEGLLAEVFCDFFFRSIDEIREPTAIPAYLRIMTIRRARRRRERQGRLVPLEPLENYLPADEPNPAELDRSVFLQWLAECVERLQPAARQILRLHYGQGMSYAQIGEVLGRSKQAVGKSVLSCHKVLQRCLENRRRQSSAARRFSHAT